MSKTARFASIRGGGAGVYGLHSATAWDAVTSVDSVQDNLTVRIAPGRSTATIGYRSAQRRPFYKTINDLLIRERAICWY